MDLEEARRIAVAVADVDRGRHLVAVEVAVVGQDRRHAGADRAFTHHQLAMAPNDRRVSDLDAGYVGDGVEFARLEQADADLLRQPEQ